MSLSVWSRHQGIIVQVLHIIVSQLKLVETTDKMQKNLICCWLRKKILCQNVKTESLTNTISNTNTSEEENNSSNISEFNFQRGTAFREGLRRPTCKKTSDYYDQSLTSLYECTTTTRTLYDNVWISNSSLLQVRYRHVNPNPDSQSTLKVRIGVRMFVQEALKRILRIWIFVYRVFHH